jgi:alpha-glucosidase (family GH31 glycosyl hydrolase)
VLARALVIALAVLAAAPAAEACPLHLRTGPVELRGLAFRTAAGWFHATRVLSRSRGRVTLATDHPGGRRLSLRLRADAPGVTALTAAASGATALRATFAARAGERYLGFGERSNAVDQRGHDVESYVAEGPFEEDERSAVPAFVPAWGFHPRDDATYFPMPWLLSTSGYGVLVDNAETSLFGLRGARAWSVESEAARLRLRVFAGPRPADVLRRLTARIGRQPEPPGPFVFGPWYQPRGDERAPPASVAQTYTHYLPCEAQRGRGEAERERVRSFHRAGLAVTTYFNPMICTTHSRFGRPRTLLRNGAGEPYVFRYSTLQSFDVAQFDFSSAAGRALYGVLLREALADGHDGWMEDFGEYTPLDARAASGATGTALHNRYPTQYHCAAFAAAPRAARFVRSGWTGTARCAPIVWGGDPSVDWGFDGLRSVVTNGLTMGLSGVSTWGSDIGGFFSLFENRLTPELLIRWIELGAVSGVMRTEANGIRIPDSPRPQVWDPEIAPHWRRWASLRTQLYPYLAAAEREYRRSGLPIMRHLALAYPRDRRALRQEDEFLFGPSLLAAPVLEPGERRRRLYLPRGRWVDLWRSLSQGGGASLRRARVLRGGRSVVVPAPLRELPLMARAGTLLTLLPPDVDTLADYGDRAATTSLNESQGRRVLLAFPRGASSARLEDGGLMRSRERPGEWSLSIRSQRRRSWKIEAALGTLRRPLRVCAVSASGGRVRAWRFGPRTKVLRARFATRRGRLVARSCR